MLRITNLAMGLACCCTLGCAPLTKDISFREVPDPAVLHANILAGNGLPYREGYSGLGGNRIHYVEAGSGPTIVFVHGFPSFWYSWFDQLEAFRHCRRVIAIDAPGAGLSAKPGDNRAYRIDRLAARLDAFIAEMAPDEKVVLVGHDWGGALAWSYAENDSSRLDRLAIFSAPPHDLILQLLATDPEQRARSSYMTSFYGMSRTKIVDLGLSKRLSTLAYSEVVRSGVLTAEEGRLFEGALSDPDAIMAGMRWYLANIPAFDTIDLKNDPWPSADAKADIPVLLVRGSEDRTFVKKMELLAEDHAKTLKVITIPNVGHWTQFQDPQSANQALADFIGVPLDACKAAS
jgi:pimeloyl-ACP methyl ester carboxylesterase